MGSTTPSLPCLDLTKDPKALEPGTPEWNQLCGTIRELLEKHGGLLVDYDRIPGELLDKMFSSVSDLLDLPSETKCKTPARDFYFTYTQQVDRHPYYEAIAVVNPELAEETQAFTKLMWSADGNEDFSQTLHSTGTRLMELFQLILKMIFDSYGVGSYYDSQVGSLETLFRMSRHTPHPLKDGSALSLHAHVDTTLLTMLCQNEIDGLEFQSREGEWFSVNPRKGSFIIFVGEALKAWSNGRLYAVPHKVILKGDTNRLTYGSFFMPKGDQVVKAPDELIDNEHPPLFKPFTYKKFLEYAANKYHNVDALQKFAGI